LGRDRVSYLIDHMADAPSVPACELDLVYERDTAGANIGKRPFL
jgi:hypothetical protein